MQLPSLKAPHQLLFLFGALLLLVALFSLADSRRRASLESIRSLPGMVPAETALP